MLVLKADGMFPEGVGAPRAFARDGTAAEKTNELLENGMLAIKQLFEQRGYDPYKPDRPWRAVGGSEVALGGLGLPWGCCGVVPGPAGPTRGCLRGRRGRWHASDRCMHAFRTVSRIIEIQSPVSVTASVPVCSYVFFNSIPCCGVQKTASPKLFETI